MGGRLRTDCDLEKVMRQRALAINGTEFCTGDTLEHLRKAHLGFECRFRFLLCKKSGTLLTAALKQ
jgi:hypothetical protein